jgi:hypothetical protein
LVWTITRIPCRCAFWTIRANIWPTIPWKDWREIRRFVGPDATVFAAIEACGGAADLADELIARAGWSVHLAHPGYVARIKQSPDKTDYSDARLLADLERVGYLPKVWLAPENIRELRRLVRYRQQLANQRRNVKLRIRALLLVRSASSVISAWPFWVATFMCWAKCSSPIVRLKPPPLYANAKQLKHLRYQNLKHSHILRPNDQRTRRTGKMAPLAPRSGLRNATSKPTFAPRHPAKPARKPAPNQFPGRHLPSKQRTAEM